MDVETSVYQAFKLGLAGHIPLERDTLHILLGLVLASGATLRCRRRFRIRPFAIAFAAALLAGSAMELADRSDDIAAFGHWRVGASLADLGRTILFPALGLIAVAAIRLRQRGMTRARPDLSSVQEIPPPEAAGARGPGPRATDVLRPGTGRSF